MNEELEKSIVLNKYENIKLNTYRMFGLKYKK